MSTGLEPHLTDQQRRAVEAFRRQYRTAVLALLFTDVERSIELRGEMGDIPASALLNRHNELIREALADFAEAQEISTAGDSFFLIFAKPSDAVRFALFSQKRLRDLAGRERPEFRVRMGIHLGEVALEEPSDGGPALDVLGMQVGIAARVTSMAGGGQILMTRGVFDNARQILKGQLLPGIGELSWLSHGPYVVKGIDEPVDVCEVGEVGVATLCPPKDGPVAQRAVVSGAEPVLGWRPAVEQTVPGTEWECERKLGEGGFGEVWLARHRRTRELRVFKFCFRADRLRSLKREMTLFRILKEELGARPDIARVIEVQFEEAPYYLELEYTSGGNLADWIDARGGFEGLKPRAKGRGVPMPLRLDIAAQIATALAAAHSVGIIHKDVKPANVLVEESKDGAIQVSLTDFGIGRLLDRQVLASAGITSTGFTETAAGITDISTGGGTRLYMAPELIAGHTPSIHSDVYSLGVLLYQLVIGNLSQPMTTDWERRVGDPLLRDDLRRCLAGDPADRFAGAGELAQRLRTLPQRRAAGRRKRLAQLSTAVLLFVAAVTASLFALRSYQLARERALRAEAVVERNRAQHQMYYSNISLAERNIDDLRFDTARQLLEQCPKEYRNWEWGHLQYLCNRDLMTLPHPYGLNRVAVSADGRRLATACADVKVRIWDLETGREIAASRRGFPSIDGLAFRADGTCVAVGGIRGHRGEAGKVWDAVSGRELATLNVPGDYVAKSVVINPDGSRVLTIGYTGDPSGMSPQGRQDFAKVWDTRTGTDLLTLDMLDLRGIVTPAISADGRYVASLRADSMITVREVETGRERATIPWDRGLLSRLSFSADNRRLMAATEYNNLPRVWDIDTGRECPVSNIASGSFVRCAALSPDGTRLAKCDRTVELWDVDTGQKLVTLPGHAWSITSVAFTPDGNRLVTGSNDKTARVWDVQDQANRPPLLQHKGIRTIAPGPGNRFLAAMDNAQMDPRVVEIWDVEAEEKLLELSGLTTSPPSGLLQYTFSPDGRLIAAFYPPISVSRAVGPNGIQVTSGNTDKTIRVWDVETRREVATLQKLPHGADCVGLSADGRLLAAGSADLRVSIWNLGTGRQLNSFCQATSTVQPRSILARLGLGYDAPTWQDADQILSVVFSPDGKSLAAANASAVKIWDWQSGKTLVRVEGTVPVVFAPDGKSFAMRTGNEGRIFDVETGKELVTLSGYGFSGFPTYVHVDRFPAAFSPDGKRLVAAGNPPRLWEVETGRELLTLNGPAAVVLSVLFSRDGRTIAGASDPPSIWEALPWRDKDLPGNSKMSYDERIQLYKIERWKARRAKSDIAVQPAM